MCEADGQAGVGNGMPWLPATEADVPESLGVGNAVLLAGLL